MDILEKVDIPVFQVILVGPVRLGLLELVEIPDTVALVVGVDLQDTLESVGNRACLDTQVNLDIVVLVGHLAGLVGLDSLDNPVYQDIRVKAGIQEYLVTVAGVDKRAQPELVDILVGLVRAVLAVIQDILDIVVYLDLRVSLDTADGLDIVEFLEHQVLPVTPESLEYLDFRELVDTLDIQVGPANQV